MASPLGPQGAPSAMAGLLPFRACGRMAIGVQNKRKQGWSGQTVQSTRLKKGRHGHRRAGGLRCPNPTRSPAVANRTIKKEAASLEALSINGGNVARVCARSRFGRNAAYQWRTDLRAALRAVCNGQPRRGLTAPTAAGSAGSIAATGARCWRRGARSRPPARAKPGWAASAPPSPRSRHRAAW